MIVRVFAVGRVRHAALRDGCDHYAGRARRYFKLEVREVAEAGRRGPTPADTRRIEGKRLAAALPEGADVIALTRVGRDLSSTDLARRIEARRTDGRDPVFLIGGAFGLDSGLLTRSALQLRLSAFTLPHDLARLVLLEQLYRAGTILRGEPYHKGG